MGNSKKTPQSPEANSIPLNIPINVFGNLLSPSSIIPDNDSSNSDKGKNKRGNWYLIWFIFYNVWKIKKFFNKILYFYS